MALLTRFPKQPAETRFWFFFQRMAPRESDSGLLLKGFHKYPTLRDCSVKGAATWLKGKKTDDDYGEFWRVHDKLYDLSPFIDKHPGGSQWLEVTRGTDITELFECSHPNPSVDKILAKYFIKKTDIPLNSPYTLKPDGFYLTLKRKVYKKIQSLSPGFADAGRKRVSRVQNLILLIPSYGQFSLRIRRCHGSPSPSRHLSRR